MPSAPLPLEYSQGCTINLAFYTKCLHFLANQVRLFWKACSPKFCAFPEIQNSAAGNRDRLRIRLLSKFILSFFEKCKSPFANSFAKGLCCRRTKNPIRQLVDKNPKIQGLL
ncbi:MAG: hypothetical protein A3I24_00690 [Candidatus Harrisonbacteria bacterium RIFCSPLOWO2_02_FULL_41_13b]|uniref:Uncharacterized protein n=1 Tax=Candidatus Harrisonbacteria bacterium RIFCSPLOWO2_02_FULL_41_13b TaxID=1798409 RepID=A0A1G1ZQS5_9BACT|nr:MAG: hypothetical protein A3I24_00690 [Candidatus Harrisonbacteria bacterium RIFCSPLOWO2_02_FULL_41_13b]